MKINFINLTEENVKGHIKIIKKIFKLIKDKKIFNIIFVTEEEIQRINREYRKIDKVTDVISFALNDTDELTSLATKELGDIFICLKRCYEQATDYGHSINREMGFLAVHGYLHLCGYDHMTENDEKEMFSLQEQMLNNVKLFREVK